MKGNKMGNKSLKGNKITPPIEVCQANKMKRFYFLTAILLLALAVFTACGNDDNGNDDNAETRDDIIIAMPSDISNLDPHNTAVSEDFRMFQLIFSNLLRESADGFVPSIAERWEMSGDGMSYTFFLRDDVYFHNGELLTSADVVFSFERAMVSPFVGAALIPVSSVTAVNDFEVRFDLHAPFAPFIPAVNSIWIVNEDVVTAAGGENFEPIGTGPYVFVEHNSGISVEFTRFDDYFAGPAPIRDVTFRVILSPATTSIALEAGEIDLAIHLPYGDIDRLEGLDRLAARRFETASLNFLTINSLIPPFDNPLVREAINLSIDRPGMITMAAEGFGTPANSFINELTFGYSPDVTIAPRNEERARELLAEAGFPDGLDVIISVIGGMFDSHAAILQSNLASVGINAQIVLQDADVFITNVLTQNYEMGILAVALPGMDANAWADILTSDGGMNFSGYSDPDIDRWFDEARVSSDPAARLAAYRNIALRVNEISAFIPLYFTNSAYVHDAGLEIGYITATAAFRVDEIRWR
ncbi:MAG: ABC transporter substrate-binding protein [Defluviitaleaceae bacterium]|nr:ABC transporter substrate-binding protein [Defluviitaleaceae bacterium]